MATAIVTVVLTFVFTGFLGHWLVPRWQHQNWVNEQRLLGEQKEYENLKLLCDEMMAFSSKRLWKMRRLANILTHTDDALVQERLREYDNTLSDWNEKLNTFEVRLTL